MHNVTDPTLAEVPINSGAKARLRPTNIATFMGEVTAAAASYAIAKGCHFAATVPDIGLLVNADPELLSSAIGELLYVAFQAATYDTEVRFFAHKVSDRILLEIESDLSLPPPADAAISISPDVASGDEHRSELGSALRCSRRRIELNDGTLSFRKFPARGYTITIDLPRLTDPAERRLERSSKLSSQGISVPTA